MRRHPMAAVVDAAKAWRVEGVGAEWPDGLKVVRIAVVREQIHVAVRWRGQTTVLRLGARVAEIVAP